MTDEADKPPETQPPAPRVRRGKLGRPAYEPTPKERQQVRTLAGLGVSHEGIALVLGIAEPTVRKYFRHELKVGAIEANAAVSASLHRQATHPTKPNAIACMFWLKCRAGWRDHDPAAGKKEQQAESAQQTAEGGKRFAPGTAPLRVVK